MTGIRWLNLVASGLVLVALGGPNMVVAQDPQEGPTEEDLPAELVQATEVPERLQDAGFERFIDLKQLGQAINDQDASLICDIALQLVEGEKVLMRPHRTVKSQFLFSLAVRIAAEKRDRDAMDRLSKIAEARNSAEMRAQIQSSSKLLGVSRSSGSAFAIDQLAPQDVIEYDAYRREIAIGRALGDKDDLEALKNGLADNDRLSDAVRTQITKEIDEASKAAVAPDSPETTAALRSLLASSRSTNKKDVQASIKHGWAAVAWGKEIDEVEYAKLVSSIVTWTVPAYLADLVRESARYLGVDVVKKALQHRGKTFGAGKFVCQGGIATYSYWEYITIHNPLGSDFKKKVSRPNHHQPFVRWKRK
jgi:hypothetical protein